MTTEIDLRRDDGVISGEDSPVWHKAAPTVLASRTTAEEALADIIERCIDHLRANEQCVLDRAHEEGVHQMRVGVRRLRSILAMFRGLIPDDQRAYLNKELRWLIGELGPARDWDVLLAETLAPVVNQLSGEKSLVLLRRRAESIRDQSYDRAAAAIRSQRYVGLVMLMGASVAGRKWHGPVGSASNPALQQPAVELANALLERRYADVDSAGRNFADLRTEARHRLRIQIKKLRYATEFFGSLYPKSQLRPYLSALKSLQDQLGVTNDIDVAQKLLRQLAKGATGRERRRLSHASGLVIGWHSHVAGGRESQLNEAWTRFSERAPFWERPIAIEQAVPEQAPAAVLDKAPTASEPITLKSVNGRQGAGPSDGDPPAT